MGRPIYEGYVKLHFGCVLGFDWYDVVQGSSHWLSAWALTFFKGL